MNSSGVKFLMKKFQWWFLKQTIFEITNVTFAIFLEINAEIQFSRLKKFHIFEGGARQDITRLTEGYKISLSHFSICIQPSWF